MTKKALQEARYDKDYGSIITINYHTDYSKGILKMNYAVYKLLEKKIKQKLKDCHIDNSIIYKNYYL